MSAEQELQSAIAERAEGWAAEGVEAETRSSPRDRSKTSTSARVMGEVGVGELVVWSSREAEESWTRIAGGEIGLRHHDAITAEEIGAALDRLSRVAVTGDA